MGRETHIEVFEESTGLLHIAYVRYAVCEWYISNSDPYFMSEVWNRLVSGGNPVKEHWQGGEDNPTNFYSSIFSHFTEKLGDMDLIAEFDGFDTDITDDEASSQSGRKFLEIIKRDLPLWS